MSSRAGGRKRGRYYQRPLKRHYTQALSIAERTRANQRLRIIVMDLPSFDAGF
jgi:hypothetical protein